MGMVRLEPVSSRGSGAAAYGLEGRGESVCRARAAPGEATPAMSARPRPGGSEYEPATAKTSLVAGFINDLTDADRALHLRMDDAEVVERRPGLAVTARVSDSPLVSVNHVSPLTSSLKDVSNPSRPLSTFGFRTTNFFETSCALKTSADRELDLRALLHLVLGGRDAAFLDQGEGVRADLLRLGSVHDLQVLARATDSSPTKAGGTACGSKTILIFAGSRPWCAE